MIDIDSKLLDSLPPTESDGLEYKSSLIEEKSLKKEIQNAASAFWNSGGGTLLAGVDDNGIVDGGIFRSVGRQKLEDWLPQILAPVSPQGQYNFRIFDASSHTSIHPDRCVLAIQFLASAGLPHQSADKIYYIRAGAHTVPASHFIVDALFAKRHFRSPKLIHLTKINHHTTVSDFLHIEIIAATDGVALDVEIDFDPRPNVRGLQFPLNIPIIDREHSFAFRFEVEHKPAFISRIKIAYRDFASSRYSYEGSVDIASCIPVWHRDAGGFGSITEEIRDLKRAIERTDFGARFS